MEQYQEVFNEKISANLLKVEARLLESIKVANSQTVEVDHRVTNLLKIFEDNQRTTNLLEEKTDAITKKLNKAD